MPMSNSDARKRHEATVTDLRASLSPHYVKGKEDGRNEVIDQLRAIVTRHKASGFPDFPAIVAISDLYTLIGDPTTWTPDGAA